MDRLLCPWDFSGKSTGVGCHFLLQKQYCNEFNKHFKIVHVRRDLLIGQYSKGLRDMTSRELTEIQVRGEELGRNAPEVTAGGEQTG